jgi:predicted 3-demethylubiquinone-9 3-methyltransferase (glyoxalase superfamily)
VRLRENPGSHSARDDPMTAIRQRITPFLWFDDRAEEAAAFYCSIFPCSCITAVARYTKESVGLKP